MIKTTLKFVALTIGAVAFIFGTSSCKKDDDDDKSCCTFTVGESATKVCEGDTYGDQTLSGEAWLSFKEMAEYYYDATCK